MADEIVQKLGLDASQAIQTLRQLTSLFGQYAKNVTASAQANAAFNKSGRDMLGSLGADAQAIAEVTRNLTQLQKAQLAAAAAAQKEADAQARAAKNRSAQGRANKIQSSLSQLGAGLTGDSAKKADDLIRKIAQIGAKANLSAGQIANIGRNLNRAFTGPQGQVANLLRQLQALGKVKPPSGPGGGDFLSGLSDSFVATVTAANLLSNAISRLTNALGSGIAQAIQYEKTLARIQTIAGAGAGNIDNISARVRELADEFGQPAVEVAAAQYELLSNQIGDATTSSEVLIAALKLSNVTGARVADSVSAISSVLNSYNLSTSEAADISAKLFRAVDLGRFTLDEVGDSLGRVLVVASQVGVSADEILASLSTLTVTGLGADEAMTLLGNSVRGLLKPTQGTAAAFAALGVESAEAGVRAFGFLGFLQKITEVAGDSASEITQLTENIRVARGFLGLTGQQADRAAENLRKLEATAAETLDLKNEIIISTNAKQVETELERIKNFFVVDLGRGALQAIAELSQVFGGLTNVVKGMTAAAVLAGGAFAVIKVEAFLAAGGITTFNGAVLAAIPSLTAFIAAAGTFAAIALPIAAIAFAVHELGNEFEHNAKLIDDNTAAANKLIDAESKQASVALKEVASVRREAHQKRMQNLAQFTAALGRANNFDRTDSIRTTKAITTALQDQIKTRVAAYERYVDGLAKANEDAVKNTKESNDKIQSLQDKANTNRFNRQVDNLPEIQAQAARLSRVQSLLNAARDSDIRGNAERADQLREEAASLAEQVASTAQTSKNRAQQKQAEDAIDSVLRQQVEAEKVRQTTSAQTAAAAESKLAAEQAKLAEIKDIESQIRDIQNEALSGKDLTNEERVALLRKAVPLAEKLQSKLAASGDPDLARKLGLGNLVDQIRKPLIDALGQPTNVKVEFEGAAAKLAEELNSAQIKVKITPIFQALKTSGLDAQDILARGANPVSALEQQQAKLNQQVLTGIKAAEELEKTEGDVAKAANNVEGAIEKIGTQFAATARGIDTEAHPLLQTLQQLGSNTTGPGALASIGVLTPGFKEAAQEFGTLRTQIQEALTAIKTDVNSADIAPLINQLNARAKTALQEGNKNLSTALSNTSTALQEAAEKQRALVAAQGQIKVGQAASSQLQNLEIAAEQVKENTNGAKTAQDQLGTAVSSTGSKAVNSARSLDAETSALKRNTAAAKENASARSAPAAAAATGAAPKAKKYGGMLYRADGGSVPGGAMFKPRGTDTIPAMLSPGEFVVNAKSTRKFFSQLTAMNAGRQPIFRANGGPVTNVNIGDVNVNSQGDSGRVVGRDAVRAINRELRRNSINLKRN